MCKPRRDRLYRIWYNMKTRCNNKRSPSYRHYGKKGIKSCGRWDEFDNFKEDLYKSYLEHVKEHGESQTTLDRIDGKGNYCLENCRWATWKTQGKNRPKNSLRRKKTKGYYLHNQTNKYCAQGTKEGKIYHLGIFKYKKDAHQAYLNFISNQK